MKISAFKIVSRHLNKSFETKSGLTEDFQNLSERELAEKAAQNDEAAFAEIVRRYSPRVFRVASGFFSRHSLIEEAAQEIFLKAFVQIKNYEARGSLEGWMTRVAATTCINLTRSAKRQPELTVSDLTDDENAWLEEKFYRASSENYQNEEQKLVAADLLKRILEVLPPEDAFVLQMIDGDGESIKTVAEMLNWSESKVKIRVFRARKKFRETMQKLLPEK